jgi:tRNA threonylcarbamoyladenosine biosynthesis protein TsaB
MILALETAGHTTHMWIFAPDAEPETGLHADWESGRELSDYLLGNLNTFIESHHHNLKDLSGIIIFSGPGSFTSLRIGHTTVNALADTLNIPVVGAMGENWLSDGKLSLSTAKKGDIAMPFYGAEAHITKPKS